MKQATKKTLQMLILALLFCPAPLIADSGDDQGGVSRAEEILKKFRGPGSNSQASDTAEINQTTATTSTFTVISPGDNSDYLAGDGQCGKFQIQPPVFVLCTFRAAIEEANAHAGTDIINFNIGAGGTYTISPASALPTITEAVIIDGTTQPGFAGTPIVELNGENIFNFGTTSGLTVTAGNSTVRGLVINRFEADGIRLATNGGNIVEGNFIGTDVSGTADLGNELSGVTVSNISNNRIGGTTTVQRNLISGNEFVGINIAGGSGNLVQGNYIGTDVSGTIGLGNRIGLHVSSFNTVGGTVAGAGNLISGSEEFGLEIGGSGNLIQGNFIGTNAAGTAGIGNFEGGVRLSFSSNTVGGSLAGARNLISGNNRNGIEIVVGSGNLVQGNFIGTDVDGTADLGNMSSGVRIENCANNTIGGEATGEGNLISGNGSGVSIGGSGATGNIVKGNFIGTDVTGTISLGNGSGVSITAPNNSIGGTGTGAGNLISGNTAYGILIGSQFLTGVSGNLVMGNLIGTDVNGSSDLGNAFDGILVNDNPGNEIGGSGAGAGNIISGNDRSGVLIIGDSAVGNLVQGNFIGTQSDGISPLGNSQNGVKLYYCFNNTIGGQMGQAGNVIAFNGGNGIFDTASNENSIIRNTILDNAGLGIDLFPDGPTPNDSGDVDEFIYNLQNFPVITIAFSDTTTTIQGLLHSTANNSFIIEFFSNDSCDSSGYGEGQTYIGSDTVVTDSSGNAIINVTFPVAVAEGKFITATATDSAGSTSEFCQCQPVVACLAMPGDANSNGDFSLGDILAIVNYYFNKPGWPGCASNTKLCWVSDLLCRGDWNGNGEISLADVIQAVNKYFNKPGNWSPVATGVCCLPAL